MIESSSERLLEESWKYPPPLLEDMQDVWNGKVATVSQHRLKEVLDKDQKGYLEQMVSLEKDYQRQVAAGQRARRDAGGLRAEPAVKEQEAEAATPNIEKIERELDKLMEDWRNGQRD